MPITGLREFGARSGRTSATPGTQKLNQTPAPAEQQKVKDENDPTYGYNALTHEFGDMMKMGVIVPTKVERIALQNAASIASLLLTTDAIVSEIKEDRPVAAGAGAGGDMY